MLARSQASLTAVLLFSPASSPFLLWKSRKSQRQHAQRANVNTRLRSLPLRACAALCRYTSAGAHQRAAMTWSDNESQFLESNVYANRETVIERHTCVSRSGMRFTFGDPLRPQFARSSRVDNLSNEDISKKKKKKRKTWSDSYSMLSLHCSW